MKAIIIKSLYFVYLLVGISTGAYAQSGTAPILSASDRWTHWRKQWKTDFPTASWAYFSRYPGTVAEYTTYKDAGLTMVQAPINQYGNATAAGLRVVSGGWQNLTLLENESNLDSYIAYPGPDLSTTAYDLIDEPGPHQFSDIRRAVDRVYQTDRRMAIPIVTMLPNWTVGPNRWASEGFPNLSYEEFVSKFAEETNPAVMLSTHYPTMKDGTDRPQYYQNVELFRNHAIAKNIGLMGFVLVTEHENTANPTALSYRIPSESDIYWQVYSMIAYGAQGIWYYNYRIQSDIASSSNLLFGEGIVLHGTGNPNPLIYPHVQSVNGQLHRLAYALMSLKSVGVFHAHDNVAHVPAGTTRYSNGSITGITEITGDNFIVSDFINQDDASDDSRYIMLVNKRHAANTSSAALQADITFKVSSNYGYVYQYDPSDGSLVALSGTNGEYTINLHGGHGRLLRISATELQTGLPTGSLSYESPNTFYQNDPIKPLTIQNTGVDLSPMVVYSQLSTIAGQGNTSPGTGDGDLADATFNLPAGITFDNDGNAYIADNGNHVIRKITPAGQVSTLAGLAGTFGNANGPANDARFRNPHGITIDNAGNLYVADRNNHRIRKITSDGTVSTLTGAGAGGTDGTLTQALFNGPVDITIDSHGVLYVVEIGGHRVRRIVLDASGTSGTVTTLAGDGTAGDSDGTGTAAQFRNPAGLALDKQGNIYVADQNNHTIRKITSDGVVSTIAGTRGTFGYLDHAQGTSAQFRQPVGITVSDDGDIYVLDYANHRIRKITASGAVSTAAGANGFRDGIGTAGQVRNPWGLVLSPAGNLWIADYGNHAIRRLTLGGNRISPALPEGLVFDELSGTISGTPTALSPATDYQVSVYNGKEELITDLTVNITILGQEDKPERSISFEEPPRLTYLDPDYLLVATASSGEDIIWSSSNTDVAVVVNGHIQIIGAGNSVITATLPENPNYINVPSVSHTALVRRAEQTITYTEIGTVSSNVGIIALVAEASSSLPVTLSIDDERVASLLDNHQVQILGPGRARITVTQPGDHNYLAARPVVINIHVPGLEGSLPVHVYSVLSPNGDGINDFLLIEGIRDHPENSLTIFDRTGRIITQIQGYDNDRNVFTGDSVRDGTYFYRLDVTIDGKTERLQGYFELRRE